MCKYSSGHVLLSTVVADRSLGDTSNTTRQSSIVTTVAKRRRLLPAHLRSAGKFTENRETTPEHIRNSRRSPGGDRTKEKMFQQKLVIVIRTFLLFFLFQPSSLVATTVEAGEFTQTPCPQRMSYYAPPPTASVHSFVRCLNSTPCYLLSGYTCNAQVFIYLSTRAVAVPRWLIVCQCSESLEHITRAGGWHTVSLNDHDSTLVVLKCRYNTREDYPDNTGGIFITAGCLLLFIHKPAEDEDSLKPPS